MTITKVLLWFALAEMLVLWVAIALNNLDVILSSLTGMFLAGAISLAITIGKEVNK
jgi:hypothetical protein